MILRFLRLSRAFREIEAFGHKQGTEVTRLTNCLDESERNLSMMTEARLNSDRSHEFLRGQMEALRESHASEVDGLKRVIDFFSPAVAGRSVFGLTPQVAYSPEEPRMQPQGSQNRRSLSREAYAQFHQEAEAMLRGGGLNPNPNGDAPADFSKNTQ